MWPSLYPLYDKSSRRWSTTVVNKKSASKHCSASSYSSCGTSHAGHEITSDPCDETPSDLIQAACGLSSPELQKHVRSSACTNQTSTIHFTTSYLFVQMPLLRNTIPRLKVDRTAQVLGRRRKTQQWNVTWSRAEANAGQLRYRPELAEGATEVSGFGIWGGAAKPK